MQTSPHFLLIAGPNGAGKSTAASLLVPSSLQFINDEVAKTLPGYPSRFVDMEAARMVLGRLKTLAEQRADFAIETTLASRSLATRIRRLKSKGYLIRLVFLFLSHEDLAIQRVAQRVRSGGHDIPSEVIRRRFAAGIRNLFSLYLPLADKWSIFDTSGIYLPRLIAEGTGEIEHRILDTQTWQILYERSGRHE